MKSPPQQRPFGGTVELIHLSQDQDDITTIFRTFWLLLNISIWRGLSLNIILIRRKVIIHVTCNPFGWHNYTLLRRKSQAPHHFPLTGLSDKLINKTVLCLLMYWSHGHEHVIMGRYWWQYPPIMTCCRLIEQSNDRTIIMELHFSLLASRRINSGVYCVKQNSRDVLYSWQIYSPNPDYLPVHLSRYLMIIFGAEVKTSLLISVSIYTYDHP